MEHDNISEIFSYEMFDRQMKTFLTMPSSEAMQSYDIKNPFPTFPRSPGGKNRKKGKKQWGCKSNIFISNNQENIRKLAKIGHYFRITHSLGVMPRRSRNVLSGHLSVDG